MKHIHFAGVTAALLVLTALNAHAQSYFDRVASFPVNLNIPSDLGQDSESSAEIITATPDGNLLVYSDSPLEGIGMVDISDPEFPLAAGFVATDGEPTSVSIVGDIALVGINTSENYTEPSGRIDAISLATRGVVASCELGGQPDSVAVSKDGAFVAIAIENERDEDLDDGIIPQLPAGNVTMYSLVNGAPDCASKAVANLTGLAGVAPSDPEPEFVDFNSANELLVTMQENNHLAVISTDGAIISHFPAGTVDLENVDTEEERALTFDSTLKAVPREPDAAKWLDNDRFVTANEGDYEGGSRGFTIYSKSGEVLYESGLDFEYRVVMAGHYPERRSGNKGVEPEGMEVATFGDETFIFLLSERGSVIGVYRDTGADPEFVQLLPTALAPEGAVAIPGRNLLAVANEADLIDDGGVRSHVTLYRQGASRANYPMLVSGMMDGRPIGWGALSGLAAHPTRAGKLYAVNDSFYALQPTIFEIDASQTPAKITNAIRVTREGVNAQLLDLEGITSDGGGGFWLASEGRTDRLIPHALYHVNGKGEIKRQIPFPAELLAVERRFGSEGITLVGNTLWIAIQREWNDDPKGTVKLVSYNIETEEWGAVRYPLNSTEKGWVGLSEITFNGDHVYILERDNQIGAAAKLKSLFRVPLSQMNAVPLGGDLPTVEKELVRDLIPDMQSTGGYVVDKIEGFAIDAAGNAFAITDNDGVDDSNGETLFLRLGSM